MVSQIDEQQMAVIAPAVDPAREADRLADVGEPQLGAGVGAIGVHQEVDLSAENCGEKRAPRFDAGKAFVNPRGRGYGLLQDSCVSIR
jgi:hypothetical protein